MTLNVSFKTGLSSSFGLLRRVSLMVLWIPDDTGAAAGGLVFVIFGGVAGRRSTLVSESDSGTTGGSILTALTCRDAWGVMSSFETGDTGSEELRCVENSDDNLLLSVDGEVDRSIVSPVFRMLIRGDMVV